ncbi:MULTISPECIES: hypothetical protein [unclassified Acinetobacter]|uniref:hypothetical protein n=1 Tax=unclassified Acinetobacter TaxID=196816 RepID=UPI0015D2DF9E|nr:MULTISPECIES: hypothetical protein [unclassified Acinetobacter]
MARLFGNPSIVREVKDRAGVEYPDLPKQLLKTIFEGEGIQLSRRASSYVVLLGKSFIQADELNLNKWLLSEWGEKLNSQQFEIASTLIAERVKAEITHHQRQEKAKAREQERALRSTWAPGGDYSFWGR